MKIALTQPVQHDGKAHAEGDVIDIPKADAEALIACGAAELADAAAKKAAAKAEAEAKAKAEAEAQAAEALAAAQAQAEAEAKANADADPAAEK